MIANRLTQCQEMRLASVDTAAFLAFLVGSDFITHPLPQADDPCLERFRPFFDRLFRRRFSRRQRVHRDFPAFLHRVREILRQYNHEVMKGRAGQLRQDAVYMARNASRSPPS